MTVRELDTYFKQLLDLEQYEKADISLNGLQIGDYDQEVKKVAFAVDACAETFRRSAEQKADLLFVHHGMFWGRVYAMTARHYQRLKALVQNQIALYAVHLPLDAHPTLGNNAGIARKLELSNIKPFGEYRGKQIGCKGTLPRPMTIQEIQNKLDMAMKKPLGILPFGKEKNETIGIVSGGATRETAQAIDEGLDCYITGDSAHEAYHQCLEEGINVLFGGHYYTETYGVQSVMEQVQKELGLETIFIDLPTGL